MKGWHQHSHEHSLAARGITTARYRKRFPNLVKPYKGQNPRLTANYARFRQASPSSFVLGTFRTKRVADERAIIVAKRKRDSKFAIQSVMIPRKDYWAVKRVEKKGKVHVTKSGEEVKALAKDIVGEVRPFTQRVEIAGSIRRKQAHPVDVDVVVVPKDERSGERIREDLRAQSSRIYADGSEKFSGRIRGVKTEVIIAKPNEFEAQLMTVTGPYGANIQKRALARDKGMVLNQRGLFKGGKRVASTEKGIYRALGLSYRSPSERGLPR